MNPESPPGLPEHLHAFRAAALAEGFDAPLLRRWAAHEVVSLHTHPFDAWAVLVEGEMHLTLEGKTRTLHPGDTFRLAREVPHEERYGPEGAGYWVARRA